MTEENKENQEGQSPEETAAADAAPDTESAEAPAPEAEAPEETYTLTRAQMERMEEAAKELATVKDQFVRQAAEYDNYRKRTAREKETLWQDAKADTILKFLPVYDNLSRAAAAEGDDDNPHKQGLIKIFQQAGEILKAVGVTEIEALGKPFDPEKHNAVNHIDDGQYGENEVSQVFQPGFMMNGKVIRHAVVQVAN
ncbi:MAG: nucleotide exchange factor GrpE [Oscillibacter sp.]|nr:nucleotide exchange factor GrpE [Oscillibacter sp.]